MNLWETTEVLQLVSAYGYMSQEGKKETIQRLSAWTQCLWNRGEFNLAKKLDGLTGRCINYK